MNDIDTKAPEFNEDLQAFLIAYNVFCTSRMVLLWVDGCTDMVGAIKFARELLPDVVGIRTFHFAEENTSYWLALPGTSDEEYLVDVPMRIVDPEDARKCVDVSQKWFARSRPSHRAPLPTAAVLPFPKRSRGL